MRLLYVINGFDPGGAEHGLLTLVEQGFFDGHDLRVLAFCHGRGPLADRIRAALGDERVLIVNAGNRLSARACASGAWAVWQQFRQWRPDVAVRPPPSNTGLAARALRRRSCVAQAPSSAVSSDFDP